MSRSACEYSLNQKIKVIHLWKSPMDFVLFVKLMLSSSWIKHHHHFNILKLFLTRGNAVITLHGTSKNFYKKNVKGYIKEAWKILWIKNTKTKLVANSSYTSSLYQEDYDINKSKIEVITNSIDFDKIQRPTKVLPGNSIGYFGRLIPRKNVEQVLKWYASSVFRKEYKLEILGSGSEMSNLIRLAKKLNIYDRVHFHGETKNVIQIVSTWRFSVFLNLREPFGLVGLESYALNVPFITFTCSGGLVDIIHPSDSVCLVSDISQIDNAIRTINNRSQQIDYRAYVKEEFSWVRMYQSYFKLYSNENSLVR